MASLSDLRKKIDQVDKDLIELLSQRGQLAHEIGQIKHKAGKAIFVPSREKKIYDRLAQLNKGPYKTESLISIFREIISATRSLEAPLKISFLGPEATFTHMAAEKYFGSSTELNPASNIRFIFEEVEKKHSDYGVVPIENSTEGVVSYTLDMFSSSTLSVCGEVVLPIAHHLMAKDIDDLSKIKTVYSHPHALAQCRQWLVAHLPKAQLKETDSTALAAKKASQTAYTAAIASDIAANVYQMSLLARNIQDQTRNFTRFLIIGPDQSSKPSGDDKTSILFRIKDEVGGLYKILSPLAKEKINLTKIESRPVKSKAWEYIFFVDLDGHYADPKIKKSLEKMKKACAFFRVLGSYPKANLSF